MDADCDYLIIGSGFGGSVSALRLAEKGYRVLVLEKGRRLGAADFPRTNWDLRRWMWMPHLGMRGLFQMTFLRHVTILSGVGVGGGSLVYANTLPTPKDEFFRAPAWAHLADWRRELEPHYATVRRMLGAVENPLRTAPDQVMQAVAREIGREDQFHPSQVAVYFGKPGETAPDPYFGGDGPERTGCIGCGGCMLGCRHGAKNTLDKNYLWLAEKRGAVICPETEVTWLRPIPGGGYEVEARQGLPWSSRTRKTFRARNVVFAAGVLGTVGLLLRLRERPDGLPGLSPRVGCTVRTNSEALIGVVGRKTDPDLSKGLAITSILHTDDHSHMEPVRYPEGSDFFRLLGTPHVRGGPLPVRLASAAWSYIRHAPRVIRSALMRDWARRTMILLYMRTLEGSLRLRLGRSIYGGFRRDVVTDLEDGPAPTPFMPEASDLADRVARHIDGMPTSLLTETVLGTPTTAHILGGAGMGDGPDHGVIDHRHRMFGYDGLYVLDGSAVSANPGVNPSLTIATLAERAMSLIPGKGTAPATA